MNLLRKIVLSWYAVALVLSVFYLLGLDVAVGGGINIYVPLAFALLIVKGLTEIDSARTVGKTLRILSIISLVFFSVWTLDPTIETTMKHTLFAIFHIGTLALSWYMIRKGNRAEQDKQAQRSEWNEQIPAAMSDSTPDDYHREIGSAQQEQAAAQPRVVQCQSCGANNQVTGSSARVCEYCGSPLLNGVSG